MSFARSLAMSEAAESAFETTSSVTRIGTLAKMRIAANSASDSTRNKRAGRM
jgi:hypothetical protein